MDSEERDALARTFMAGVDAYNRRDFEAFLPLFHPDVEYFSMFVRVEGGNAYRGMDGMRRYWKDLNDAVEQSTFRVDELEWHDDLLLAIGKVVGTGRVSGAPLEYDCFQGARFQDGLLVWCSTHTDRAAALKTAEAE
jgi:ketosteroid isomerase-like protein